MNLKKRDTQKNPLVFFVHRLTSRFWPVVMLLLCANLPAQQAAPLRINPDEAVNLALRNNLGLESSRTSMETKRRASRNSWNQFIPNVTVGGSLLRDNEAATSSGIATVAPTGLINYPPIAGAMPPGVTLPPGADIYLSVPYSVDLPQWHTAASVQAQLNISIAMFENMKRLRLDYEGGLLSYEKAKLQLERDVRKAYHNMLLLQENIALLRGSFENAERQVQMAQANFNAGLTPELTLLQARVARENLRPIIDQAESGLKLSMAQFAMYLGLNYDTQFELTPVAGTIDFTTFDITQMISMAAAAKPDIQELRQTIMMLESARKAQIYALTPSLSISWNNNLVFTGDPWKDAWFGSDKEWRGSGSLTISLGLRLHSLIPFSTDFQGIRNVDDQIKTANIGLAQMITGTEIEIYNILLTLERTRISAEAQEQTVNLAERSYLLTEQAYRAGLQDYFQVQNAEQSLRQARVQMLEQQFNYLNSLIDLEYSTGVPFGTLSIRSR
ncbi:MAG: TolC family protein [Treponema sp.]|jgi:outer membrane protein TolC|nr:TolC family protein [Treponema sp.]